MCDWQFVISSVVCNVLCVIGSMWFSSVVCNMVCVLFSAQGIKLNDDALMFSKC